MINGERVMLRDIEENDWEDVHQYASQSIVCKYQPWGPNTIKESQSFVKEAIKDFNKSPRTRFVFAIIEKQNEKMIGVVEFNIRDEINRNGEIGYIIHPMYWGQGFATEVAKLIVNFSFYELNMHRIYATCDPRNIASSKVLEKIGLTLEGRMRQDLLLKDGWRDSLLYSILDDEWRQN